ncbi:MAG: hypothetical protein IPP71_09190 [Bacteroidetes bacterium]|nr:hypothetical protein [Bacteroidota bacterium]
MESFTNETILKHRYNQTNTLSGVYTHPSPTGTWFCVGSCFFYDSNDINTCNGASTNSAYDITGPGAGNVIVTNSSFLQPSQNISIPYLANIRSSITPVPLNQLMIENNTFKQCNLL